jgi:hypothetical protein
MKTNKTARSINEISTVNYRNFFVAVIILFWLTAYSILQSKVNSYSLEEINTHPKYIFMYLYQLVAMEMTRLLILMLRYTYSAELRHKVVKSLKGLILNIWHYFRNLVHDNTFTCNT